MHYRCDRCRGYHADAYAVAGSIILPLMISRKTPKPVKNRVMKIDNRTYEASEVRHVTGESKR